ncbi:MAG TPA: hypothetical protein VNR40_07405, partial [Steroidobacter sp.]|nr:hypothetical protein [Steroidobacter sp.]
MKPTTTFGIGLGLACGAVALMRAGNHTSRHGRSDTHIQTAQTFNRSSALLALSVLADSAMEHYRGSFDNPAMYTPLVVSTLSLLAGAHGGRDVQRQRHAVR